MLQSFQHYTSVNFFYNCDPRKMLPMPGLNYVIIPTSNNSRFGFILFDGISTIVGYLYIKNSSISNNSVEYKHTVQFYLAYRYDIIRGYYSGPEYYWSFIIRLFSVISRTLIGRVLSLCRDAVGVFCSPSWLGHQATLEMLLRSFMDLYYSYGSNSIIAVLLQGWH